MLWGRRRFAVGFAGRGGSFEVLSLGKSPVERSGEGFDSLGCLLSLAFVELPVGHSAQSQHRKTGSVLTVYDEGPQPTSFQSRAQAFVNVIIYYMLFIVMPSFRVHKCYRSGVHLFSALCRAACFVVCSVLGLCFMPYYVISPHRVISY